MEVLTTSQEVQAAKNIRKTTKGALTRIANQLKKDLVLEPGNKYNFTKIDKFSISADADRLEKKLEELYQQNEAYVKVCKEVLIKNKASEDVLDKFEESNDSYYYEAKKDASLMLNLYKYEYTTALQSYLKSIEEDNKPVVAAAELSSTDKLKIKKKADGDITRQQSRWNLLKTEWECLLSQAETDTESTRSLTVEDLLKQPLLIDADQQLKLLGEQWESIKSFQETLHEVYEAGGVEPLEAARKLEFDASGQVKRMQVVKAELSRLSVAIKRKEVDKTVSSTATLVTPAVATASTALKMDKIQTPKFSGKPEDFATWKDRFIALVPRG